MRFKIHSISDIITNSSSEVFLVSKDSEIKNIKGLQSALGLLLQMPVDGKSRQFTMEFILRKKDTVFLQKTFEKN